MSTSEGDILRHLGTVTAPIDVRELARALDTQNIDGLNYGLGNLVRKQRVKRHHSGDGVLRYTLPEGTYRQVQAVAVHPASLLPGGKNKPGVSASKVLAVISDTEPQTKNQIVKLTDLTDMQVQGALQALRRAGLIVKHGKFTDARWTRATQDDQANLPPQAKSFPCHTAPVVPSKAARATAEAPPPTAASEEHDRAVAMAEAALQRYVESCVDQHVHQLLHASVVAAKAARDRHLQARAP